MCSKANLIEFCDIVSEAIDQYKDDPYNLITSVRADLLKQFREEFYFSESPALVTIPWLTKPECDELLKLMDTVEFVPNPDEPVHLQIPEYVVEGATKKILELKFDVVLRPLIFLFTGHLVKPTGSIQLAQYTAEGINNNDFHYDEDGDITVTVDLGTVYKGGYFQILPIRNGDVVSETHQLLSGRANIFMGRTILHRGTKVHTGTKSLLVFWCKLDTGADSSCKPL